MNVINAVTVGKLIEGHVKNDQVKFNSYAHFIIDSYRQQGDERSARIIEKYLNGENEIERQIVLDKIEMQNIGGNE